MKRKKKEKKEEKAKKESRKRKGRRISSLEIRRFILHIITGIVIIFMVLLLGRISLWILLAILVLGIILSLLSLKFKVPFIYWMLEKFERPYYLRKFPGKGGVFFIAGCLLCLKLFPQQVALASIAILTFGDSVSHLVGLKGRINHQSPFNKLKHIEGTLAGIIVAFIAALFFVKPIYAFIAALIAMLAEAISVKILGEEEVDDNIIVPLIAGTAIYLLTRFGL